MSLSIGLSFFYACVYSPFDDYWQEEHAFPQITSISPSSFSARLGGEEVEIIGNNLASTQTVVIGSRNAEIISATDTAVRIVMPALSGGASTAELSLITTDGYVRLEEGIEYTSFGSDWWGEEKGSFSLLTLDCPIEAYGLYDEDYYPIFWCALEMGYSYVEGNVGSQLQPGFAGDFSGLTPLSSLPEQDVAYFSTSPSLGIPTRYGSFQTGDTISIETARNVAKDIASIEEKQYLFEENYYWIADVENIELQAVILDDDSCFLATVNDFDVDTASITVEGSFSEVGMVWLGYSATELYEGEAYFYEGVINTAVVSSTESINENTKMYLNPSGVQLSFSDYSGIFIADNRGTELASRDIPFGETYDVALQNQGEAILIGNVEGGERFDLTWPYLIGGQEQISKESGYLFEWNPIVNENNPTLVVAEIRVYDMDVNNPNGWHEVARLVKSTDDANGWLEFTAEELSSLPIAKNEIDDEYNLMGLWGEVSIARHHFRKIHPNDNSWVFDFVHAIQSPIDIID